MPNAAKKGHRGISANRQPTLQRKLSPRGLDVLRCLMSAKRQSGADITRATGTCSGTLYPMLQRLEDAGWLKSKWEKGDPSKIGRPLKRLYSLTPAGRSGAKSVLSSLQ